MARWKLTEPHYLNCPEERYEQTSIDSRTGKPKRTTFKVPKHLDPRVEDDWNVRFPNNMMDGEIHVCHPGKGNPTDIVFEGNPTPGMVPLDDEAREITGKFDWTPTQGIDEESQRASFYSRLTDKLVIQMQDMKADAAVAPQAHGMDKFLEAMSAMMAQNQQILAALAVKGTQATVKDELTKQAEALGEAQAIDEEPPLEHTEPTAAEIAEAEAAARAKEVTSAQRSVGHMRRGRI